MTIFAVLCAAQFYFCTQAPGCCVLATSLPKFYGHVGELPQPVDMGCVRSYNLPYCISRFGM